MFTGRPAGYVEFDITEAMRNWKSGQPNYGLLVWATNEESSYTGLLLVACSQYYLDCRISNLFPQHLH